jgi:hypothetical protein
VSSSGLEPQLLGRHRQEDLSPRPAPVKHVRPPSLKKTKAKKGWGWGTVKEVGCLTSKCMSVGSNPISYTHTHTHTHTHTKNNVTMRHCFQMRYAKVLTNVSLEKMDRDRGMGTLKVLHIPLV